MKLMSCVMALSLVTVLLLFAGCGGGGNTPLPESTSASLTITWPERSRLIPLAAESIEIRVDGPDGFTTSQTVNRPEVGNTSTVNFPNVPLGQLTFTATAYPEANGQGVAQATATVTQTGLSNVPLDVNLTMASTVTSMAITPATPSVLMNSTTQLDVTAKNATNDVVLVALDDITWQSSDTSKATVDDSGLVTGVAAGAATITATYGTVSAETIVTVTDPNPDAPTAVFTASPASGDVTTNFAFDASGCTDTQDAAADLQVRWDWEADGTYDTSYATTKTAQHQFATAGTYTVRLQVKDSGDKTGTTEKTITVKVKLTLSPNTATLTFGGKQTFTAQVQGSAQTGVSWSVQENNGGAISPGGVYTAPQTPGTFHVVATSVADPTVSVTVPVTVAGTSANVTVQ